VSDPQEKGTTGETRSTLEELFYDKKVDNCEKEVVLGIRKLKKLVV